MCSSSKPNYPEAPVYPEMPEAPDMGPSFELAIKNQEYQNQIADRQAGIAEGQMDIARDRYGLSREYRPLQKEAMEDAARGRDPNVAEGKTRNSIMQRVTPMHEGLSSTMQGKRGMKPDSPNVLAAHENLGAGLAGGQAAAQTQAREQTNLSNLKGKADAVGVGRGIPAKSVAGMSAASDVMGDAGRTAQQANTTYMGVLQSGQQASYQASIAQWQYETNIMQMNYQYDMAIAEADAAAIQSLWGSTFGLLGMVAGGAIGFAVGGPMGMAVGSGLGGMGGGYASGF